ncbi:hypothetical protein FQP90_01595 [Paenarthrobacter nitroguajacolicus]|uniref:Uncharacterized protein n=1 Tax=Paenarthrobacter nitroguajacolicus TaxID=211146 RepID=A0A558HCK4_PAENT|nr:hypothetical protein [Paenarthrobacter nitroguajacolicus]TVU66860.1 hypothetical protein FQP90_01595 [Paenarthrobacter nitroguajacolicus]
MPYQGGPAQTHNAQTHNAQAHGTQPQTAARSVTVIPAVDLYLGTVTILSKLGTARFRHPEARLIARALAKAVRPTQWCEASGTLTVTVAAVGKREGRQRHFIFRQDGQA